MKITFFSNFLNHHQLPFCLEMKNILGDDFKFVATQKIPNERIKLGYEDMNSKYDFVVESYKNFEEAELLAINSDIVIMGEAPNHYLKLRKNKVSFRYSERVFKSKYSFKSLIGMLLRNYYLDKDNNFLLCASAYASNDYNKFNFYVNRTFKWGYFPEVKKYANIDDIINKKDDYSILWVGRFIKWKHPEIMLNIARNIKEKKLNYRISMIGEGVLKDEIKNIIEEENLGKYIVVYDSMPPQDVRKCMEKSKIFVFTSDRREGWGAVLNESMNSACIVVANKMIGSVPYVINNGINGFVYNNINELNSILIDIHNKKDDYKKVALNAYETMNSLWNPKVAAERFIEVSKAKLNGKNIDVIYNDGPLSPERRTKE